MRNDNYLDYLDVVFSNTYSKRFINIIIKVNVLVMIKIIFKFYENPYKNCFIILELIFNNYLIID